ncbi:TylF/MycF/NovP-related O-methyltransferase [Nitrosopumilus sp.]|uniref:TylF/MycF/NovP-related O-methyltransferase n=1 Tax=Nitrosopumilus sp. TaxID=2024843 RepID=UPI003D0FF3CB
MTLKEIIQKMTNQFGYHLIKIDDKTIADYQRCYPYTSYTYSPWFSEWFQKIYDKIKNHTKVTEDRCYVIYILAKQCLNVNGDFAECGVYKGGTSFLISSIIDDSSLKKQLHLFDTFKGMPKYADDDPSSHTQDDFNDTSEETVKSFLQDFQFIEFYPGLIPLTFKNITEKTFSFVHIDVDLYKSVDDCCKFFYSKMNPGGVMLFDDYGFKGYQLAARKAVDEFFKDKPENPLVLQNGQCLVIKL